MNLNLFLVLELPLRCLFYLSWQIKIFFFFLLLFSLLPCYGTIGNNYLTHVLSMKTGFEIWAKKVFIFEGGFSDDRRDPGNWSHYDFNGKYNPTKVLTGTNRGITWETYFNNAEKVFGKRNSNHFFNLTIPEAKQLAYKSFWVPLYGDQINNDRIAINIVYSFWGGGGYAMVRFTQNWLKRNGKNIEVDSIIGNETVKAINSLSAQKQTELADAQVEYRTLQLHSDPNYKIYPGWDKALEWLWSLKSLKTSGGNLLGISIFALTLYFLTK